MANWKYNSISIALLGCSLLLATGCGDALPVQVTARRSEVNNIRKALEEGAEAVGSSTKEEVKLDPTGFVTLKGSFKINGTPPANVQLDVSKDKEFCAPNLFAEDVVVDAASKGIKNVVIFADGVEDNWFHESAKGNADEVIFDQKGCLFLSHVFNMQSTQTLVIKNSDPGGHNTKMEPRVNVAYNSTVGGNSTISYKPEDGSYEKDPFEVTCSIHPWMKGYILIRGDAYSAVTKADGTFEIPNLPAGVPLELRIWQEKIGGVDSVTFNGQPANWRKGRMTITLDPDEAVNQFEVVIDASEFQ